MLLTGVIAGGPAQLEVATLGGTGRAAEEGGRPADAAHSAHSLSLSLPVTSCDLSKLAGGVLLNPKP